MTRSEPSLNLGNFAPFALLTGAGFTCNWGGLSARTIWEKIVGANALCDNDRLKRVLGQAIGAYESALHIARSTNECSPEDCLRLENAVVDVFRSQEARISARASREKLNESKVREFLSLFGRGPLTPNVHDQYETGYHFTLNQDWLIERLWHDNAIEFHHRAFVPGVHVWGECYKTDRRDMFDVKDFRRAPDSGQWPPNLRQNQNYIKLHGSFEWRSADGSNVLVMGGGKSGQIRRFPLLVTFFDVFRRVCETPDTRLMIIGYGFGDPHVNELLATASQKRSGDPPWIFVIDKLEAPEVLKHLQNNCGSDGRVIADAIFGWSSEPLTDIFPPPRSSHRSEEYRRILKIFFNLDLP